MSASLNKAQIIGHLGNDPEIRFMPDGDKVVTVSIATTATWKDKAGTKQERTEWHRVVFFRKLAEIVEDYLKKGSQVYVEGPLQTQQWEDKQGVTHYSTIIVGRDMKMLGKKESGMATAPKDETPLPAEAPAEEDF